MLLIAFMGLMATTMFAQNGSVGIATAPAKSTQTPAKYICPKCMASSDKPGKCQKCHVAMVKEGMYYCPGCGATSTKPGKCTKCNMEMVKMTASTK